MESHGQPHTTRNHGTGLIHHAHAHGPYSQLSAAKETGFTSIPLGTSVPPPSGNGGLHDHPHPGSHWGERAVKKAARELRRIPNIPGLLALALCSIAFLFGRFSMTTSLLPEVGGPSHVSERELPPSIHAFTDPSPAAPSLGRLSPPATAGNALMPPQHNFPRSPLFRSHAPLPARLIASSPASPPPFPAPYSPATLLRPPPQAVRSTAHGRSLQAADGLSGSGQQLQLVKGINAAAATINPYDIEVS